ncbi:MAG: peptidase C25 [Bacteroidetes bacterium MedPE-SWsnd-G2]|nr:MAG: peptidase C25 [Bacteroidetes bacterium MedPE-SWsnd-G2]
MKNLLLTCLLLTGVLSFGQQKNFLINWDGTKTIETATTKIQIPAFSNANFSYDFENGLVFFEQWETNVAINENTATLSNVVFQSISKADLKGLDLTLIPSKPEFKLENVVARDNRQVLLQITPIIKDAAGYKKITSFSINYSNSNVSRTANRSSFDLTNSILRTGEWHKFYIDTTGVFRLTKGFLEDIGVNVDNVDPRTIKLYGNGGQMLPMENAEEFPIDIQENAIKFVGEQDGVFNDDDYILFYGVGPKGYNEESITHVNAYTDKTYYYINISGGFGSRISEMGQPEVPADYVVNTFQDYQFYEKDEYNLVKIGRRWFGDRFDIENQRNYTFNFPNLVTDTPIDVRVYAAASSESATTMDVNVNGANVDTFTFPAVLPTDHTKARDDSYDGEVLGGSDMVTVTLTYNNSGNPASLAYLDFISIEATRELNYALAQMKFYNKDVATTPGVVEYQMTNASDVWEVWDVTNPNTVSNFINSESASTLSFKAQSGEHREYVAFNGIYFMEPKSDGNNFVANQDIKGSIFLNENGDFEDVDYIILMDEPMRSQAERLADINRQQYGLNVKVLSLDEIYAEFSTGNPDISAIRNLVRYVYLNASSQDNRLKYVCFFGDASYDYKDRISGNTNIVPTWHSYSSFSLTNSFVSDDFFGMMDESEGDMTSGNKLDIAVGRILADTPQRAKELVDKIDTYYAPDAYGSWRNNFIVISDDVDAAWEKILQSTTDEIGNEVNAEKPFINVVKIHSDSYQQESSSSGDRYPDVNTAIKDAIEVGALVVNYFGHGGEDGLAKERVFDKIDAQEIRNICKYNMFVTVTCEYTKFDNPQRDTAGEFTYWNPNGGSIGLITTTRQIIVNAGVSFNIRLEEYLFSFGSNDYVSAAEALRLTKIDPAISGISQRRLVFYIGDPAMKLAFPKPNVRLTKINDVPIGQTNDTLKALSYTKLAGEVVDENGNLLSNYNGVLSAKVFDKNIERQTLANNNISENGALIKLDFETLGEVVFNGQANVANGLFEFDFVVPRDIGIPVGPGKVSFYTKSAQPLQDNAGASYDILVGDINQNADEDNLGPTIQLFLNDENFVSGGITNESPTLIAKLEDDNGINTASGIGHDIVAIIDGDETNPFVLNDYYQADVDTYQSGAVSYPFRDLEPGQHTLTLKAWDVYNNSSISELQFTVFDKDEELVINNVLNYPNPFVDYTEFWFNHNSVEPLDVSVQIFTVSGKLVRTLNGQTSGGSKVTSSLSKDIVWDGRDDFGDKIGKGVYIYKLKVRSNLLGKQVEKIEKLVIL